MAFQVDMKANQYITLAYSKMALQRQTALKRLAKGEEPRFLGKTIGSAVLYGDIHPRWRDPRLFQHVEEGFFAPIGYIEKKRPHTTPANTAGTPYRTGGLSTNNQSSGTNTSRTNTAAGSGSGGSGGPSKRVTRNLGGNFLNEPEKNLGRNDTLNVTIGDTLNLTIGGTLSGSTAGTSSGVVGTGGRQCSTAGKEKDDRILPAGRSVGGDVKMKKRLTRSLSRIHTAPSTSETLGLGGFESPSTNFTTATFGASGEYKDGGWIAPARDSTFTGAVFPSISGGIPTTMKPEVAFSNAFVKSDSERALSRGNDGGKQLQSLDSFDVNFNKKRKQPSENRPRTDLAANTAARQSYGRNSMSAFVLGGRGSLERHVPQLKPETLLEETFDLPWASQTENWRSGNAIDFPLPGIDGCKCGLDQRFHEPSPLPPERNVFV